MTLQSELCWPEKTQDRSKALSVSGQLILFTLSFILAVFGHPIWFPALAILTSTVAYALFWRALLSRPTKTQRFWTALFWFGSVQALHLSWMTKDHYVGLYIFPAYLFFILALGIEFGILSLWISQKNLNFRRIFALSGFWLLCEWSRLWFMTGFSWNPLGMALTWSDFSLQVVGIVGIYGLSFLVIFTNLLALKIWLSPVRMEWVGFFVALSLLPYIYGYWHIHHELSRQTEKESFSTVVLQPALKPEDKYPLSESITPFSPLEQWAMIIDDLTPFLNKGVNLIVMPEATVPYGTDIPIYTLKEIKRVFHERGLKVEEFQLPPLNPPWASAYEHGQGSDWIVGNRFIAQLIANIFNAEIIIGLEDIQRRNIKESYNAAFLLKPFSIEKNRYEKRVLVPMGEYIPFEWCKKILKNYGIEDSFTAGKSARVLTGKRLNYSISICYEETFGHLMREGRNRGGDIFVNLTNDVWYPRSQLPYMHYLHGRLRAVENGIPLIRSCNTGVSCIVDPFGRLIGSLPYENGAQEGVRGALHLQFTPHAHQTLYSRFGDTPVIIFAVFAILCGFIGRSSSSKKSDRRD